MSKGMIRFILDLIRRILSKSIQYVELSGDNLLTVTRGAPPEVSLPDLEMSPGHVDDHGIPLGPAITMTALAGSSGYKMIFHSP